MKIYGRCDGCKKNRFFTRKRSYRTTATGWIRSQGLQCGTCYKAIKAMVDGLGRGKDGV